jgi:hypothetical protein
MQDGAVRLVGRGGSRGGLFEQTPAHGDELAQIEEEGMRRCVREHLRETAPEAQSAAAASLKTTH